MAPRKCNFILFLTYTYYETKGFVNSKFFLLTVLFSKYLKHLALKNTNNSPFGATKGPGITRYIKPRQNRPKTPANL